ncbi:hypothetical protein AURDEDRAFT_131995 [Auricularia subglabra TFB-10046 SS5]|uniref:WD40 repeat-like protein n=1 Tax=Auricularia subglabra (strain TFB-10046 / SS5) TaxID=717982 RepID=J0L8U7_AURST|nr:hypothetical protein AURDEDRAFT_131995 [Auricularia subglabra TFB-10046 SS5]
MSETILRYVPVSEAVLPRAANAMAICPNGDFLITCEVGGCNFDATLWKLSSGKIDTFCVVQSPYSLEGLAWLDPSIGAMVLTSAGRILGLIPDKAEDRALVVMIREAVKPSDQERLAETTPNVPIVAVAIFKHPQSRNLAVLSARGIRIFDILPCQTYSRRVDIDHCNPSQPIAVTWDDTPRDTGLPALWVAYRDGTVVQMVETGQILCKITSWDICPISASFSGHQFVTIDTLQRVQICSLNQPDLPARLMYSKAKCVAFVHNGQAMVIQPPDGPAVLADIRTGDVLARFTGQGEMQDSVELKSCRALMNPNHQ